MRSSQVPHTCPVLICPVWVWRREDAASLEWYVDNKWQCLTKFFIILSLLLAFSLKSLEFNVFRCKNIHHI